MLIPISNAPRAYAWGGRDAISRLLGRPPSGGPEAELWLGTHHGSPAHIIETAAPLSEVAGELPFLMKVLAAAEPLSLQVHPDAAQASAGFAREDAAGVRLEAPERVYKDRHAKTEIILAVSERFEAQAGFRTAAEASALVERLVDGADGPALAAARLLRDRLTDDAHVGDAFFWLLSDDGRARGVVESLLGLVPARAAELPVQARLAELYPRDAGVVASLLLNHVVLRRGEALAIPPGTIHGYLEGIGIELLTASDNVVRGGLTPKHIDRVELARLLRVAASAPVRVAGTRMPEGGVEFVPPAASGEAAPFRLHLVEREARIPLEGPAIALCVEGAFEVAGASGAVRMGRGDAVFASADESVLEFAGDGELYLAQ